MIDNKIGDLQDKYRKIDSKIIFRKGVLRKTKIFTCLYFT